MKNYPIVLKAKLGNSHRTCLFTTLLLMFMFVSLFVFMSPVDAQSGEVISNNTYSTDYSGNIYPVAATLFTNSNAILTNNSASPIDAVSTHNSVPQATNLPPEDTTPYSGSVGSYGVGDLIVYETTYTVPKNVGFIDTFKIVDTWTPASGLNFIGYIVELNGVPTTTGFNVTPGVGQRIFTFNPASVPAGTMIRLISAFTIASTTESISNNATVYINGYHIGTDETTLYTVTYVANWPTGVGTSGTVPVDNQLYESNATVTVLGNIGNLTADGYTFIGWLYNGTLYHTDDTFMMPTTNVVLTAVWSRIELGSSFSVVKTTCPTGSGAVFNFATSASTGIFSLSDGQVWNSPNLQPGTYVLAELAKAGWNIANIIVEGTSNYTTNLAAGTITFTLEAGQHATIVYQNTERPPQPSTFSVAKVTCPVGSLEVFNFATSAPGGTFSLTDGEVWSSGDLPPGTYVLAELAKAGWNIANIIVEGTSNYTTNLAAGTITFTLEAGQHATIVYQNTERAPLTGSFSVAKVTCPVGSLEVFNFATSAPGGIFSLTDGEVWSSGDLPPGTYIVAERVHAGWDVSNIIVEGTSNYTIDLSVGMVTFTVEAGRQVTVIYQNAERAPLMGSFSVAKVACPVGFSTPFTFVTSAIPGIFNLTDGEVWSSGDLLPGTYIVTELAKAGWDLANIIVTDPNGTSTVDLLTGTVILNLQAGSHITLIYQNTQQSLQPDCCKKPCQCKPCSDCCTQKPCECKPRNI